MLLADMIAEIRARTDHDGDTQVEDVALTAFLTRRAGVLFRRLARAFPERYRVTTAGTAIAASIAKPADYGGMIRVEHQATATADWCTMMRSSANPENDSHLGWSEGPGTVLFAPAGALVGNVRFVYRRSPGAAAYVYVETDILPQFEDVLIEEGIGFTRERAEEKENAREKAEEAYHMIRRSYLGGEGVAPVPGFMSIYGE